MSKRFEAILMILALIIIGCCIGFFLPIYAPLILSLICFFFIGWMIVRKNFVFLSGYIIFLISMWAGAAAQIVYASYILYIIFWMFFILIAG